MNPGVITCHTNIPRDEIIKAQSSNQYCKDIIQFLTTQYLPLDPVQANTIFYLANSHLYVDKVLCKTYY